MAKYQTLATFVAEPFGRKSDANKLADYSKKYSDFTAHGKISISKICIIENSYYYHIKVPSESQQYISYDVVIRFFTNDAQIKDEPNLQNYYIQFFSNSPSFIYQYAYVYKENGYLIKSMYDKLDPRYINVAPDKTNVSHTLSFDKSIYFACRCLLEKSSSMLSKNGAGVLMKKVHPVQFFRGIKDVETLKIEQSLIIEDKKLSENIKKAKRDKKENKKEPKKTGENENQTSIHIIKPNKKITGGTNIVKKVAAKKKI